MNKEVLTAAGVDYEDALARFLNNAALYERFLLKFPEDPSFPGLVEALAQGDTDAAFRCGHTLKGVVANLSLQSLFTAVTPLVEALRREDLDAARQQLPAVEASYTTLCAAIRQEAAAGV